MTFSLNGEEDARQYLNASLEYLSNPSHYRRMRYPFPNVQERCLLCGRAGCSRWKGYYVRNVICTRMNYAGPIAIHLAQCRSRGVDYTHWPNVLIPYRRPSIPTLRLFHATWVAQGHSISAAIDEVVGCIEQEIFIPVSVAYLWLIYILKTLLLNHVDLHIRAPEDLSTAVLRTYSSESIKEVFQDHRLWCAAEQIILAPP